MIPSSAGSSLHSAENAATNSMVSQLTENGTERIGHKQDREKQVIVYNYYMNDRREGWKQVEKNEIPQNTLIEKTQGNFTKIPPNRLEDREQASFSEILPDVFQN